MTDPTTEEREARTAAASRTVMRNSAWLIGQPLALNVISIASTGYIARRLGTDGFATFNIGLAFATLFSPLTSMGMRSISVRHVAQHRDQADDYLGKVLSLTMLLGVGSSALTALLSPWSSPSPETQQVTLILSILLFLNGVVGVLTDGLHAFEEMGKDARASMWGGIVLTIASVAVVAFGGGPSALALSYLIGPVVTSLLLYQASLRVGIRPRLCVDLGAFKSLLSESLPFFGQGVFNAIRGRVDLVVLARTIGEAGLGGYTAAGQLISRVLVVVDGAATALLPSLARSRKEDPQAAVQLLRRTLRMLLAFTVPMAACVALAAPEILVVIFGSGYEDGAPVLAIGIMAMPVIAAATAMSFALLVMRRDRFLVKSTIAASAATSVMIVPASITLGLVGAPIARVVGKAMLFLYRIPETRRHFRGMWQASDSYKTVAVTLVSAVPFIVMRLAGGGTVAFLVAVVAATPIYLASILLSGILSEGIKVRILRAMGFKT